MEKSLKSVSYYATSRKVKEIIKAIEWANKLKKEDLVVRFFCDKQTFQLARHNHLTGGALDSTYPQKKQHEGYTIWRTKDNNLWIREREGVIWSCYRSA